MIEVAEAGARRAHDVEVVLVVPDDLAAGSHAAAELSA